MTSRESNRLFWYCQVAGWLGVAILNYLVFGYYAGYTLGQATSIPVLSCSGIFLTSLYRNLILHVGWKNLSPEKLLLRMLPASVVVSLLLTVLTIALALATANLLNIHILYSIPSLLDIYVTNFTVIAAWSAFYFGYHYFTQYKQTEIEKLKKELEAKDANLNALKMQVSPHFLFNSMNALQSLIDDDPKTAKLYVQELSQVYRYMLQSNEKTLITLKEELEFINAYFFLLKTRHGEFLKDEIVVPEQFLQFKIPPLTLQMLVENAVKHNVISASRPLIIKIYANGNHSIIVSNNLQKKTQLLPSNKIGLKNIAAKYKLLEQEEIVVQETAENFTVTLPLMEK